MFPCEIKQFSQISLIHFPISNDTKYQEVLAPNFSVCGLQIDSLVLL